MFRCYTFVCFLLSFYQFLQATSITSAYIAYEHTGEGNYTVQLHLSSDCQDDDLPDAYTLHYSSTVCGISDSITVLLTAPPEDITSLCPSESSPCSGGDFAYGFEKWVYEGELFLPFDCGNDWVVSWSACCRSYFITMLSAPTTQEIYVSARIDNTLENGNNSPIFNGLPVNMVNVYQMDFYNPASYEADGEMLIYSFVDCKTSASSIVVSSPFTDPFLSPTFGSGALIIDPVTGLVRITPDVLQVGPLCLFGTRISRF